MLAGGLLQAGLGIGQKAKAAKMAAGNKRPEYEISQQAKDNQALAESMASEGLSDSAKQLYTSNADRGLTSSIDAILKGGGDVNAITDLNDGYNQSLSQFAMAEDQAKFRNLNILMRANDALGAEHDKAWQINQYAPYADKAQQAAQMSASGMQNISGGINTGLSALSMAAMGKINPSAGVPGAAGSGMPQGSGLDLEGFKAFKAGLGNKTPFLGKTGITVSSKASQNLLNLGIKPLASFNETTAAQPISGYYIRKPFDPSPQVAERQTSGYFTRTGY